MELSTQSPRRGAKASLLLWIPVFALVAATLSCGDDGDDDDDDNNPPGPRTWLYEQELDDDPSLFADPEQVVILDIEPDDGPGEVEHSIPHRYREQGSRLLAVAPDDPYITRVELRDRSIGVVETTEGGAGGAYLDIAPGDYTVMVYHGGKYLVTAETTVIEEGKSVPVPVLEAVSPSVDPTVFADRAHLFSFVGTTYNMCNASTEDNYTPHSWRGDDAGQWFGPFTYACSSTWDIDCPQSQTIHPIAGRMEMLGFRPRPELDAQIQDTGDGTVSLSVAIFFAEQPCSNPYVADKLQVDTSFHMLKPKQPPVSVAIRKYHM
jgi:hypothetical protein